MICTGGQHLASKPKFLPRNSFCRIEFRLRSGCRCEGPPRMHALSSRGPALRRIDRSAPDASEPVSGDEAEIAAAFAGLPMLLDADAALVVRGGLLNLTCLLGSKNHPFYVSFAAGRIVDMAPAPILMRSWCFSYRASPAAWAEFWKPVPRPGWHDLLALTKNGEAVLEGDVLPFITHLQYFKDVLALPRARTEVAA